MRWRFPDPSDPKEEKARRLVLENIDGFWRDFAGKRGDLDDFLANRKKWDVAAWMRERLDSVAPELMWEFSREDDGKIRLIVTPESNRGLRPMVDVFLSRAPKLDGWKFGGYRLPAPFKDAVQLVEARSGGDISDFRVKVKIGTHYRVDLEFLDPGMKSTDDRKPFEHAFIATECLLGEEMLDHWIGAIEAVPLPKPGIFRRMFGGGSSDAGSVPIAELVGNVQAAIETIRERLPTKPLWEKGPEPSGDKIGSLLKREAEEAAEYSGRSDLFVYGSWRPEICLGSFGSAFHSSRFSKCGEIFCYLKLDGSEEWDLLSFPDRATMEDALDDALISARTGCVIGGGTGRRYSYIDLAVTDVDRTIEIARRVFGERKLSPSTWLLFLDTDWSEEWIGLYPDTRMRP